MLLNSNENHSPSSYAMKSMLFVYAKTPNHQGIFKLIQIQDSPPFNFITINLVNKENFGFIHGYQINKVKLGILGYVFCIIKQCR